MSRHFFSVLILIFVGQWASGRCLDLLGEASSTFSQKLYQEIAVNEKNIVYSPYSIHLILTLAYYGARRNTAAQMRKTLDLTLLGGLAPREAYRNLILQMSSVERVSVKSSNALFINPTFPVKPAFRKAAQKYYFSQASNFNLDAPNGPEKVINDYVADNTNGLIQDLLPRGSITEDTSLVLVNTLFFNGTWAEEFSKYGTHKEKFHGLNGFTSQVNMMKSNRYVEFKEDFTRGVKVMKLLFVNHRFALYIVLPLEVDGIVNLESQLKSSSDVDDLLTGLKVMYTSVRIPKFKIETTLELKEPLKKLGMKNAFNPDKAAFNGISTEGVYISQVVHKAVIDVTETGTVAAAATAVIFPIASSAVIQPRLQANFIADHPFVFFLWDDKTTQILFQGKFSG